MILEQIQDLEANLAALAPVVILLSSVVLGPEASERAKKVVPLGISAVVTILTFVATEFPGEGGAMFANIVGQVVMVTAIAVAFYSSMSGLFAPLLGGRSLNEATGPGIIGRGN